MSVALPAGNNPFGGGSITRTSQTAVAGAIASANTRVGNPAAGVAPGTPFNARPNSGTNIGIPYARLVPLNNGQQGGTGLPVKDRDVQDNLYPGADATQLRNQQTVTETQDMRPTRLGFILGKRSNSNAVTPNGHDMFNTGSQRNFTMYMQPGMKGIDQFQQMCSFPYLERYFDLFFSHKNNLVISLDKKLNAPEFAESASTGHFRFAKEHGVNLSQISMLNTNIGGSSGILGIGGAAATTILEQMAERPLETGEQADGGIYIMDEGLFLRGRSSLRNHLVECSKAGDPKPWHAPVNFGDELDFAALEQLLTYYGLTDWRPDGLVMSVGTDDFDPIQDEYVKARDGQLFNMRIQGPALSTEWSGESSQTVYPMDKVFVCIVADVLWDVPSLAKSVADGKVKDNFDTDADAVKSGMEFDDLRKTKDYESFASRQLDPSESLAEPGNACMTNFRLIKTTSSELVNATMHKIRHVGGMDLKIGTRGGQYIVGGWCIGFVMDAAASRATMPMNSQFGGRHSQNTAAHNLYVKPEWISSEQLWVQYQSKRLTDAPESKTSISPRYISTNVDPSGKNKRKVMG